MAKSIADIVDDIRNATYGREVRTAIADGIQTCYADVTTGKTAADSAASSANSATIRANNASASAEAVVDEYNSQVRTGTTLLNRMEIIEESCERHENYASTKALAAADSATTASTKASEAASSASEASQSASAASSSASTASTKASQASISAATASTKADEASESATTASTKASDAAASATSAANSATTASTKASDAAASATSAANSATTASTKASDAATSATSAANSATTASTKASEASASATTASTKASEASASATSAVNSATTASTKASDAAASATSAANSATTASTKADEASESATTASTKASDAAASATSAVNSATSASSSASTATTKASEAQSAAELASDKADQIEGHLEFFQNAMTVTGTNAEDALEYAERSEAAAVRAENATRGLDEAIAEATEAAEDARDAADTATEATSNFLVLQNSLTLLRDSLNNTYIPTIESSITRSNTAISNATELVTRGNTVLTDANAAIDDMHLYESEWLERRSSIDATLINMQTATQLAEDAEQSIENMTVTSESISTGSSSAEITDVDDHKNIHFKLRKGDPGESYIIKGEAYATVEDLEQSVSSPSEGDLYNVGAEAPYNVYRWTGNEWEDQGEIGISIHKMTNEDVDCVFNNTTIDDSANKYMGANSVVYYTTEKILPLINQKVTSVSGKGLSTNDFTNSYKDQVDLNKTSITVLSSNKVDKVSGKGLSSNDFTTAYKTKIDTNTSDISSLVLATLNKDFSSYTSLTAGILSEILFAVNYNSQTYKLTGAQLVTDAISIGGILTNSLIATTQETRSYLGITV